VVQLAIRENALYAATFRCSQKGVFIPTSREYKLGDDVYVLMIVA
jgi:type IV pilus assembly protein PilZ